MDENTNDAPESTRELVAADASAAERTEERAFEDWEAEGGRVW